MSKELDRARNLCARRPIPPAIRQLIEPLEANAPDSESVDFAELHAVIDELLPIEKPKTKRKTKDAELLRSETEREEKEEETDQEIN
jgi:hypothetical protein